MNAARTKLQRTSLIVTVYTKAEQPLVISEETKENLRAEFELAVARLVDLTYQAHGGTRFHSLISVEIE